MKGGTRKRGKTWSYYFDTAHIGGKRKKIEKSGFRTKKEAEAALAQALAEYDNSGQVFTPAEISVSDYLDFWFEQYCRMNLSENTQQTYANLIKNHLKPHFGIYRLKALQAATIQEYINTLKQEQYSKATMESLLAILSTAFRYAIEPMRYVKENPCDLVKIGKVSKPVRKRSIITDEDFRRIIERFPAGTRHYLPLMIGWNCGLRIGECCGLLWDDIDFADRTISIERQVIQREIDGKPGWAICDPKYDSKRKIKFGETLYKILKEEKRRQAQNELMYGEFYTVYQLFDFVDEKGALRQGVQGMQKNAASGKKRIFFVCLDENGKRTTPSHLEYCQTVIRRQLGIPFEYHSLRHTHATRLIESRANVKAVQQRLGHKNITTTMNTYVHHTDDMAQEAADIFERVVNGLPPR